MSGLGKRLDALEQRAAECHRREMRELVMGLPEARDLAPDEVEAATDEAIRYLEETRCPRA